MRHTLAAIVAMLTLASVPAFAGITDSPLPNLGGQKAIHLFSVPGVINGAGTSLATYFLCTSTSTAPQTMAVELFAADGTFATSATLVVGAGRTVGIGTSNEPFIDLSLGAGVFPKGAARIVSTSKNLICSAFLRDIIDPTGSMTSLSVVSRIKQRGD